MPDPLFDKSNLIFQPQLNLFRISQRKIYRILGWLVQGGLALFGLFGLYALARHLLVAQQGDQSNLVLFYWSALSDMFLWYLVQRKQEKTKSIDLARYLKRSQKSQSTGAPEQIDVSRFLDKGALAYLESAWLICYRRGFHYLRPIHIFSAFVKSKQFKKILKRLNCQPDEIVEKTERILENSSFSSESSINLLGPKIAADVKEIFIEAYLFAILQGERSVNSLDLLWAISQQKNLVGMIFDEFGISPGEIERVIRWAIIEKDLAEWESSFFWQKFFKPKGKLDRAMIASLTPTLDKISRDLTMIARQGKFEAVLGRQKEIEEIFNCFNSGRPNVVLVGESSVGKRAVLKKIAQLMVEERVPDFLKDKRLVELEVGSLVGMARIGGRPEEYLKETLFEVNRAGNIVLAISNLESLVGLRSHDSGIDFSEILSLALRANAFLFIGSASQDGYANKIEGSILGEHLTRIEVDLPPANLIWQILISKIYIIEQKLKITFSVDALDKAIELADRYFYGKALTAKAMDLLVEAGYLVYRRDGAKSLVSEKEIAEIVAKKVQVPVGQLTESEKEKLLNLEREIHKQLINQEEAVRAVSAAMRRSRLELGEKNRTICNLLFVGPTGVGKTELAKALTRVYYGKQERMIRLDMSEYQEKSSLRRLIGFRGEKGTERGYLTEAIKRQPYSLLLLDELEKAHPDILNIFLQVMDDGRLTDASGETINFSDVILIATSNAGTNFIQQKIKNAVAYQEIYQQLKDRVLLEHFSPEFLNRFDKIVMFRSLTRGNMVEIARLFINSIKGQLSRKGLFFEAREKAIEELAELGYDPLYGARPLRRAIQEKVENPIAKLVLQNNIGRRDTIILKPGLEFEVKRAARI